MRRSSPLAPGRRKVRPRVPDAVRAEVKARTHGRCHLCLYRLGKASDAIAAALGGTVRHVNVRGVKRIAHVHHVYGEQQFPELVAEPANLIGLCHDCHAGHHHPGVNDTRIPRGALLPETLALADGHGPRSNYLDRHYPVTDAGRFPAETEEPTHG